MNLTSSIGKNCRSILREYFSQQQSSNQMNTFETISKHLRGYSSNAWKPCHSILTNPIHSFYDIDHLRIPVVCCEQPSYCNTLWGLSTKIPWNNSICNRNILPIQSYENRQNNCRRYLTKSSENCIQMITNCIIQKIRCQIPSDEMSLLCCCLPSLIRQIMSNSPWLTPNDIIQWLSADIIKESMNCFDQIHSNINDDIRKIKSNDHSTERFTQRQDDNHIDDQHLIQSGDDDNQQQQQHTNLSSHSTKRSITAFDSPSISKSNLDVPISKTNQKKQNQSRTPSTRSFTSQRSQNLPSDMSPSWDADNQSHGSDRNSSIHSNVDARNFDQDRNTPIDSKENNQISTTESIHPSSRTHIDYPGKKDSNAIRDVEKCLAFYQQIREHFDDDVAAMLLKCCLCYGDCSGKK